MKANATSERWRRREMLLDVFYIGVALLFLAGCWGLVKALDRL
jgi:hypothetical protein